MDPHLGEALNLNSFPSPGGKPSSLFYGFYYFTE